MDPIMTKSNENIVVRGYSTLTRTADYLQSAVLLLCRLAWGWEMYLSGHSHLFLHFKATVDNFISWNIPMPTANVYISGITEMVGGILLMLGLATRLISIPLVGNFVVAILTAGADSVKQFLVGGQILKPDAYGPGRLPGLQAIIDDTAFPFMMISLLLLAFGPGKASIDYLIKRFVFPKRHAEKVLPL